MVCNIKSNTKKDVLDFAYLILSVCHGPFVKDKKGFDRFDAYTVREILSPDIFGITELEDEEIEYLRQKLLRYKKQIVKIAKEHNIPQDTINKEIKKLYVPISQGSFISYGQINSNSSYGRISLNWLRKNTSLFGGGVSTSPHD